MKKFNLLSVFAIAALIFQSCETPWQPVFNGENLDNWDTYVGPTEEGGEPVGLNKDPLNIFTVVDLDGEKVIHISGEVNASLATKEEFENYHLSVQFKWGEKIYTKQNSGLLYHGYGNFGAGLGVWMSSHEFQLWTGHIGDSYRMGNTYCEIPMKKNEDGTYTYSKDAKKMPSIPNTETKIIAKDGDYEKPTGEWNTLELYCYGTTSVHVVNGNVNMINYNSSKYLGEGKTEPLSKGKIQFQSEGGELYIREVKIQPVKEIPAELLK